MITHLHAVLTAMLLVDNTPEQADYAARSILDQHAHALAEKIRDDTSVMGEAGDQYSLLYANVIDPQARRTTTTGDDA